MRSRLSLVDWNEKLSSSLDSRPDKTTLNVKLLGIASSHLILSGNSAGNVNSLSLGMLKELIESLVGRPQQKHVVYRVNYFRELSLTTRFSDGYFNVEISIVTT